MDSEHPDSSNQRSSDDHPNAHSDGPADGPVVKPVYVFISAVCLMIPSCIPFYFALHTDIPRARPLLIGLGVGIVALNTMMLVLIVRWLNRYAGPDTPS